MCGYACIGCGKCGKKAINDLPTEWVCLICGTSNKDDPKVCSGCGFKIVPAGTSSRSGSGKKQ